jgi:putative transposase
MGVNVSKPTIKKLMRSQGLQGIPKRKGVKHFKCEVTTTDLVNREFLRTEPDRLWVTEITELSTREGKLYC